MSWTRGRIVCARAVTLARRNWKENDRLAVLYTQEYGKLPARFIGVNRPQAKLKALSEPMVWGEYRLHMRQGSEYATVLGGSILSVFPRVRSSFQATLRGFEVCELLDRLTPAWQPNEEKYNLGTGCLSALEDNPGAPWVTAAFALRLLESAGFGFGQMQVSASNRRLWDALHSLDFPRIASLPDDPPLRARLEDFIMKSSQTITDRPLRAAQLRHSLAPRERALAQP